MAIPTLSPEERAAALDKAKAARKMRADFKHQIANGEITFEQALERRNEDVIKRLKVAEFLRCIPGVGDAKVQRIMQQAGISESRRLGGLGANQINALRQLMGCD